MRSLEIEVAPAFEPLLRPARYKGAYGGRGGAKSHFFAEQVLTRCLRGGIRIVCIREVQNSIRDSVRQLLVDKIGRLGLESVFSATETEIRGPRGSLITFRGMQSFNAENIKSLEGYDVAWVEEAQTLSQRSLDLLRPTLRKPGSELWFSWNPRFSTDPVDVFFRKKPHPDAISVWVNWQDNPWLTAELIAEKDHDYATDEDRAEHIWGGGYYTGQGTILAKWISQCDRDGRLHDGVEFDPLGSPIEISSDIGFRDTAAWWFWQRQVGGFRVFCYDQDIGLDADDWCPRIQSKLISLGVPADKLGKIWLPQDAKAKTFQSKHSAVERFLTAFGPAKVAIVPPVRVADRINAARVILRKTEIAKTPCEEGLEGLRAWSFEFNEETGIMSREPRHDAASHPGDAFSYGAVVMQQLEAPKDTSQPLRGLTVGNNQVTLDELWQTAAPRRNSRI